MNYLINDMDDAQPVYEVKFRTASAASTRSADHGNRRSFGRRRGKSPQQFNGIHRRRNKKIRW
jgi:hypothetical protein